MAKWIVGDWHLGEDRMSIMSRPYRDGDECVAHMIEIHNTLVKPDDEVIVVGDVCYQKKLDALPLVAKFNGRKTLVRGNHDRGLSDADLSPFFDVIVPDGEGIELTADGIECYATHYPTTGVAGRFNLVGHIHSAWKYQLNMFNVGVDANHYRPVNLDSIGFHFRAICEFYDEDVWVAYDERNSRWRGIRGKKGTYFQQGMVKS